MKIVPLIMCGGSGTRLWPASREAAPKQFIKLMGERSSFQDTVLRVSDRDLFTDPVVITAWDYRHIVADQLDAIGMTASILLEPSRRDSGPAIAAGTSFIAGHAPDAVVMVLAADHRVEDQAAFTNAVRRAGQIAERGHIVTLGIRPDHPATGFGYIRPGTALDEGAYAVDAFVEKPDHVTAARYLGDGYLWNSGNFIFPGEVLLAEYARFDPVTKEAAERAVAEAGRDLQFLLLDRQAFGACTPKSIDYAVMEHTDRAAVVPVSMGWSDVGSWQAVWELTPKDAGGNAALGDAEFLDARGNLVVGDALVCLVGVDDLAVVSMGDAILVYDRRKGDAVRELVGRLKQKGRQETQQHLEVFRPWGSYQLLDVGSGFQVKRIVVKPGGRLSLQKHFHRAEHWVVVRGTALVTIGTEERVLRENESTYIPLGQVHRLENPGRIPLEVIEVQSGDYLGEDDIVRLDDVYNRTSAE